MSFALIEVEATAKKATRGAGYGWGVAEEASKAARWLCAAGIDGVAALARALEKVDGKTLAGLTPTALGGDWRSEQGLMCPLTAGAALSDATVFWAEEGKRIDGVVVPVLLLPFAANAARQLDKVVTLSWDGTQIATDGYVASVVSGDPAADSAETVVVRCGGEVSQALPAQTRATPSAADWSTLNQFAHRTYAPDTEESRLKGAGAGLNDND